MEDLTDLDMELMVLLIALISLLGAAMGRAQGIAAQPVAPRRKIILRRNQKGPF
jgi:hypothetical protein